MACKFLKPIDDVWKNLWSKLQITLRTDKIFMTHIGCQEGQLCTQIRTLPVPTLKPMDCERMTKVMKAGSFSPTAMRDAALPEQLTKKVINCSVTVHG